MDKKYKTIIIIALGVLLLVAIGAVIFQLGKSPSSQNGAPSGNVPEYTLDSSEESKIKEVATNFVSLYNTYSQDDVSNITSMGDFQTPAMQTQSVDYASSLQDTLKPGYSIRTNALLQTFTYRYPTADRITVTEDALVDEQIPGSQSTHYTVSATLEFQKVQQQWFIASITYKKK